MQTETDQIKAALRGLTGHKNIKVRQGTNSHRHGVHVFLPLCLRGSRLPEIEAFLETQFGRIEFMRALRIVGPRKPYFVIQPLCEPV